MCPEYGWATGVEVLLRSEPQGSGGWVKGKRKSVPSPLSHWVRTTDMVESETDSRRRQN